MMVPRLLLAVFLLPSLAIADESQVVPLWPGGRPGHGGGNVKEKVVESGKGQKHDRRVSSIHEPSLTVFLPSKEKATGAAVVICPGGGTAFWRSTTKGTRSRSGSPARVSLDSCSSTGSQMRKGRPTRSTSTPLPMFSGLSAW